MLALVFVDPFHLDVEERIGIGRDPGAALDQLRQPRLAFTVDRPPAPAEGGILRKGFQRLQAGQVPNPCRADRLGHERGERRVRQGDEAPGGDAVGHVQEFFRADPVEIVQNLRAQKLRVQAGDAVDPVAADAGEMRHPDVALPALVDQREPPDEVLFARIIAADSVEEAAVDLIDDLKMARQDAAEKRHRPLFEGLREEGVVRVAEAPAGDLPGLLPADPVDVHQQAHQLGDADRRVGVVELDRVFFVEPRQVRLPLEEDPDHVLQGAGDEEKLLHQPQAAAGGRLVVGVQDLGEVLGADLVVDGAVVVAHVERAQVEGGGRLRLEEAQHDDRGRGIAGDHRVVGDAADQPVGDPADAVAAGGVADRFRAAAEGDVVGDLGTRDLPGIALAQPLIRHLLLPPVADFLGEDAELVTDAVADRRDVERGE